MPSPSRPTLTGLTRSSGRLRLDASPETRIARRHAALGAVLGGAWSFVAAVPVVGGEAHPIPTVVLAGVLSSCVTALAFVVLGSVIGAVFASMRDWFVAGEGLRVKRASAFAVACVAFGYVLARGAGEAFRMNGGEPLGLGSCEFIVEGIEQLALPLLIEYSQLALGLFALAVGVGVGTFALLSRSRDVSLSLARHLAVAGVSGCLLSLFVVGLSSQRGVYQEPLTVTADLSLLASWAERRQDEDQLSGAPNSLEASVRPGPSRAMETIFAAAARRVAAQTRPHVLLIMLESVGVEHLGYMGYSRPTTPRLDQLAARSRRYLLARTTATHSNYAQMAVLSSLFPRRYAGLDTYRRLDYPRVLWHDLLHQVGYATATISSQDERWQGMIRFEQSRSDHPIFHSANYDGKLQMMGAERTVPDEVTARRAVQWMEKQTQPFGLYVNFQSTHFPYVVPAGYRKRYVPDQPTRGTYHYLSYPQKDVPRIINRYDNALSYVDEQVGVLVDALSKLGLLESTILIVTSDHGESFGDHDLVTHGRSLFDVEARVPLLIHYPEGLAPGDDPRSISTLDVLPTLAGLLNLPAHPSFQGMDLLSDDYGVARPAFINIQGMRSREGVVCEGYKYTRSPTGGKPALFDLSKDPSETKNIADEQPERAQLLDRFLSAHMRAQVAYHRPSDALIREERFAPRFAACPSWSSGSAAYGAQSSSEAQSPSEAQSSSEAQLSTEARSLTAHGLRGGAAVLN